MLKRSRLFVVVIVVFIGLAGLLLPSLSRASLNPVPTPNTSKQIKIRWVLAHEPIDVFRRAADYFAKEIAEKSEHRVEVEVLTVPEFAQKYNRGHAMDPGQIIQMIQQNKIEMSQMYTTALGSLNKDMYVLDMPFLFRDHEHAKNVLDGEIGRELLAGLYNEGHVRGLAFTYSGGYRVIPANRPIRTVEDFRGMSIRTAPSPVAEDTFLALGAHPVPMDLESVGAAVKSGQIQGAESTFVRVYGMQQNKFATSINDTKHSLFLTAIILSPKVWNSLSPKLQALVSKTALAAAQLERDESIKDAEATKKKCEEDGMEVVELPLNEQSKFKAAMAGVYKKYATYFTPHLLQRISRAE